MDARFWTAIRNRARRLKIARRVVRLLFGPDMTAVEQSELDNLFGYVTLWNDVTPVIDAARTLLRSQYATATGNDRSPPPPPEAFTHYVVGADVYALTAAFARYDDLYLERAAPTQ